MRNVRLDGSRVSSPVRRAPGVVATSRPSAIVNAFRMAAFAFLLAILGCRSSTSAYGPVVTAIASGSLPVPADGVVTLPAKWKGLTPRGLVHVERRPDGRLFVLFPTSCGRGEDVDGWLYCSGPLAPADFYSVNWGAGGERRHMDACGRTMLTITSQAPPWYRVTRRLD